MTVLTGESYLQIPRLIMHVKKSKKIKREITIPVHLHADYVLMYEMKKKSQMRGKHIKSSNGRYSENQMLHRRS